MYFEGLLIGGKKMVDFKICKRCVMDTTDPEISFDDQGYCNHCTNAIERLSRLPKGKDKQKHLAEILEQIKADGKNKKYDCVLGVSGGVDSSYVALITKEFGLRPLAVHLDNGWDSEVATQNIKLLLEKLEIDLYTYTPDWDEFRDLQLSFLKASTPDSEIPSDHAIFSLMWKVAADNRIKHIIAGYNLRTESILPRAWSQGHFDWKYIKLIQKRFGTYRLKSFPHFSPLRMAYYKYIMKIRMFNILNYIDYDKEAAINELQRFGWSYYGGKHYESFYTKIFQSYILPIKFGFDKRKAHLSSLIVAGHITREQALQELSKPVYPLDEIERDIDYLVEKLQITREEFERIMKLPPKCFSDYPSYQNSIMYKLLRKVRNNLFGNHKVQDRQ